MRAWRFPPLPARRPNGDDAGAATSCGAVATVRRVPLQQHPDDDLDLTAIPSRPPAGSSLPGGACAAHPFSSSDNQLQIVPVALPSDGTLPGSAVSASRRLSHRLALVEQRRDLGSDRTAAAAWPVPAALPFRLGLVFPLSSSPLPSSSVSAIGSDLGRLFLSSLDPVGAGGWLFPRVAAARPGRVEHFLFVTLARESSTDCAVSIFSASAACGLFLAPVHHALGDFGKLLVTR